MKEIDPVTHQQCLNCGAEVNGAFCHQCGQATRDNSDRSLGRLMGDFFNNVFFLDNRLLKSFWYLFRFPGQMTIEFLEGKRKKFVSPVSLFLFLNLIYFFFNPLSDYSLALYDQINSQYYSQLANSWVQDKIQEEQLDESTYSKQYQNTSDNISKSIMILNVPLIAFFIYLFALKKRKYYFDNLIFSFHYFTICLTSWILLGGIGALLGDSQGDFDTTLGTLKGIIAAVSFVSFTLVIPLLYGMLSIKKFMNVSWYWAILAGFGTMLAVLLTNMFYRLIVFIFTFWAT